MNDRSPQKPAFCPFIYSDGDSIFLEFSTCVLRFPFTEGGLHKALKHIPNVARQPGFVRPNSGNVVDRLLPKIAKSTKAKREVQSFSQEQRNAAGALIRKLKMGT